MPDFDNCKWYQGNLYCWDFEKNTLIRIELAEVPLEKWPQELISQFVKDGTAAKKNAKEESK